MKASSLLESVIAITVLSVCTLIAIKLYASVLASSYSYEFLEADLTLNKLSEQIKRTKNLEEENFTFKTFKVSKSVNKENNISKVTLTAQMKKDTIVKQYLIYNIDNEE